MRVLTGHKVNGCNDALKIEVLDEPGSGGASHAYLVRGFDTSNNPSHGVIQGDKSCLILFQNGPIAEVGTNGVTHEALLAIVIDRLESFQAGPYQCEENAAALSHLQAAQAALKSRTEKRLARGVEGTHTV
ncbi:MAG: hypothetical protein K1X57_20025 [Gemmataceae bacterium]|nr:hypothetical protein [Gemmataceae bacterium]